MVIKHTDKKFDPDSTDGLGCSPCDAQTDRRTDRQTPDTGDLTISASDN